MKKTLPLARLLLLLFLFACATDPASKDPDGDILRKRKWSCSNFGKTWATLRFNPLLSGELKAMTNPLIDQYRTYSFNWEMKGPDSVQLNFDDNAPVTFRIYYLNDSILVTNNWVNGPADTSRLVFYMEGWSGLP